MSTVKESELEHKYKDVFRKKCRNRGTFPTEGNPMRATLASPDFRTSKPSPFSDFFDGSKS